MKHIVVLGGGFAGLIAAVGAVRKLHELSIAKSDIAVTLVNRDPWHAIRMRNYEPDLSDLRVPLAVGPTKMTINRVRIYPPRSGDPAEILAAAAPVVRAPPRS